MNAGFNDDLVKARSTLFLDSASLIAFLGTGSGGAKFSNLEDLDLDRLFTCVGEVWGDDMLLGSCTVLPCSNPKKCFALTAAHVVRRLRVDPYVRASMLDRSVEPPKVIWQKRAIKAIHWQSGETFLTGATNFPKGVDSYRGESDRLALLELEGPFPADFFKWLPSLPEGRHPFPGDVLVVAGWGEDAVGNHPDLPWAATTRCRLPVHSWRGVLARERSDLFNGMPRSGDSGGPVFMPPLSAPLPPNHLRLIGVHSGRVKPHNLPEEVAAYIPIDPIAEQWIRKTAEIPEPAESKGNYSEFVHRNRVACRRFPDDLQEILPFARKLRTKGADLLLKHNSRVELREDNGAIILKLENPKASYSQEILLERETKVGAGGHWYTNENDSKATATYYLFLKQEHVKGSAWIHIEAFVPGSNAVRPSAATVSSAFKAFATDADIGGSAATEFVEDQDDEGNGHDPP